MTRVLSRIGILALTSTAIFGVTSPQAQAATVCPAATAEAISQFLADQSGERSGTTATGTTATGPSGTVPGKGGPGIEPGAEQAADTATTEAVPDVDQAADTAGADVAPTAEQEADTAAAAAQDAESAEAAEAGAAAAVSTRARLLSTWCGLERVDVPAEGADAFTTKGTSQSDVDWFGMEMYYDRDIRAYLAIAQWKWTKQGFLAADTVICSNNSIGGFDGVGLRFSGGDMRIIGKAATAWGNPAKNSYKNDYGTMNVPYSNVSDDGVGFRAQDKATKLKDSIGSCRNGQYDYNMWGGNIVITFKALNSCRNVQMYPGFVHTWDNQSVNSIGAGPYSFSIGWSSSGDNWIREEAGPSARICT